MSLIAHWPLGESQGSDEAYGNYDAEPVGSGLNVVNGIVGTATDFNGSDDQFALPLNYNSSGAIPQMSVAAWVKVPSGGGDWAILDFDRSEYFTASVDNNGGGNVFFATTTASNSIRDFSGNTDIHDNNWHHVVWTFNADATNDKKIYIDGELDAQTSQHGGEAIGSGANRYGFIGNGSEASSQNGSNNGTWYEGLASQVRYYDHELSKAEVKELAQGKALHMKFDKSPAEDSSRQNQFNESSTSGGVTVVSDNKIGESAFEFTGSNGVTVQNNSTLQITTDATICFWAKPFNISASRQNPFHKDYRDEFTMTKETNGDLSYYFNDSDSAYNNYQAQNMFRNDNEWVHVAAVRNNGSNVIWYRNGSQYSTKSWNGGDPVAGGNNLQIGDGYTNPFDGIIDDFRIYATALSDQEIQTIYETKARLDENHRFFGHQLQENNIRYEWYDTQTYYNNNSHPNSTSGLDQFFDPSNSGVNVGGSGIHENSVAWGNSGQAPNSKPSYLPSDGFSWKVDGSIYVPETGTYTFGVDSDDASDIFINGTQVASFYGGHGFSGNFNNNGTIDLQKGNHSFRARMEEGGGGDGIHVVWQKPSDSSFSTVPQENYLHGPSVKSTGKIESTFSEVGPAADNLLAWWKLNGNTKDFAGGYDATNNGAAIRDGVGQTAYFFDGSDYIRAPQDPYAPALDENSSSLTLSGWIRPTALNTNSTNHSIQNCWIAHSSGSFNDNMELGVDASTNDIQVYFDTNGSDSTNASTGVTAPLDTWTHVIVTLNLNGTPTMKVYKNGNLQLTDTSTWSGTSGTLDQAGAEFTIGASRSFRDPFTGFIQDVRIYEKDMTDEQAAVLYEMSTANAKMKKRPEGFYAPQFSETQL